MTSRARPSRSRDLGRPRAALHAAQHRLRPHDRGRAPAAADRLGRLLVRRPPGRRGHGERRRRSPRTRGPSRSTINAFRADYQKRRIRTLLAAGHISASDAETRQHVIDQRLAAGRHARRSSSSSTARSRPSWPAKQGVTVTAADVDARLKEEATTPEAPPRLDDRGQARARDRRSRRRPTPPTRPRRPRPIRRWPTCKAGKDWETVAKSVSTDATKDQAGDLGFIDENTALDPSFRDAILAAAKDTPTDVIEGADGIFRIGRVTEIVAPVEDATLASQVSDAGIGMDDFRAALRRDVTRTKLNDAILAPYLAAGAAARGLGDLPRRTARARPARRRDQGPPHPVLAQRRPGERGQASPPTTRPGPRRRTRPTPPTRSSRPTPTLFDSIARAESDETSASDDRRQAAVVLHRRRHRRGVRGRDLHARPPARPAPRAGQVRVRLARDPGHALPDGRAHWADQAQDRHRRRQAAVRRRGAGQLGQGRGGEGRRHRLGRQGPARRGRGAGDLRRPDRQGQRPATSSPATASTCSS